MKMGRAAVGDMGGVALEPRHKRRRGSQAARKRSEMTLKIKSTCVLCAFSLICETS